MKFTNYCLYKKLLLIVACHVLFVFSGCSPQINKFDNALAATKAHEFADGTIQLECKTLSCAGYHGWTNGTMREYDLEGQWSKLAKEVIKSGWYVDISYFYLGKSAENLGLTDSALKYYYRAMNNTLKCKGILFDNCNGYDFPNDIQERIRTIKNK